MSADWLELDIVGLGREAQRYGLRVGENPAFGGVTPGAHAPNGHHPTGEAFDLTDWRSDVMAEHQGAKPLHWKERTRNIANRLKQLGVLTQVLGPGDRGHDEHVHAALEGKVKVPKAYLDYAFTGRWQRGENDWSSEDPRSFFAKGASPSGANTYSGTITATSTPEPEAPKPDVAMDWRADTTTTLLDQGGTENQGMIQWAAANKGLAARELGRHGLGIAAMGQQKLVAHDDPRAVGRFGVADRGAAGGTRIGRLS